MRKGLKAGAVMSVRIDLGRSIARDSAVSLKSVSETAARLMMGMASDGDLTGDMGMGVIALQLEILVAEIE